MAADIGPLVQAMTNLMELKIGLALEVQKKLPATGQTVIPQIVQQLRTKVIGATALVGTEVGKFNAELQKLCGAVP